MAHRLNTNKQFMIGNGILAFSVIFVVVIFVYMSMRLQQQKAQERKFIDTYTVVLQEGFLNDSLSILINDSLLLRQRITSFPLVLEVNRFDEQSTLMLVDHATDNLSLFPLEEKSGTYRLTKRNGEVTAERQAE